MSIQKVAFSHYDTAEYLQTEEDIAAYLNAVLEENDPALLTAALGDIARARNMSQLAKEVGMSREGLYKALSGEGNPSSGDGAAGSVRVTTPSRLGPRRRPFGVGVTPTTKHREGRSSAGG